MLFFKFAFVGLCLATWFKASLSTEFEFEDDSMQGDREKRTLILGVLFKKLLLQQAFARNARLNATTAAPPMNDPPMDDPTASVMPPPQDPQQGSSSPQQPQPPQSQPQQPQPPQPLPMQSPPPQAAPQVQAPAQSLPQGILPPQGIPQRPQNFQVFPSQQGFHSLNRFGPQQQGLIFPTNYPFGIQRFNQLPFGPAPPLGAQAGPQGGPRLSPNYPFGYQNGFFQAFPQQQQNSQFVSSLPPSGPSGGDAIQQGQPSSEASFSQGEQPPTGADSLQQVNPSAVDSPAPGPSGEGGDPSQGPPQPTQAGPIDESQQQPPIEQTDQSQSNNRDAAPASEDVPQELSQNFSEQGPGAPNGQDTSQGQEQTPPNFQFPNLDNNFQQQFNLQSPQQDLTADERLSNGFSPGFPQNFQSQNRPQQPQQADNSFFNLRQLVDSADNSVFGFSQEGASQTNGNNGQQQPQPESSPNNLPNELFSSSGPQQLGSSNDPRSNFEFRGQQFDFTSPFQNLRNFQRSPFQQNFF